MTSKSKAGNKLAASIRKSKSSTVARKNSLGTDKEELTAKPKVTTVSSALKSGGNQARKDILSHGCRVWPD